MSTYEELGKIAKTHKCQTCSANLSVAWGGSFGIQDYIVRCTNNAGHKTFTRPYQPTNFEIIEKKEMETMTQNSTAVGRPRVTTMTKNRATEIVNSLWGDAPNIEKAKAIMVCMDYGANPLMKHIFLIPFKKPDGGKSWEMVFGIKFKRLLAYRVKPFSYADDTPRLMTEDEQKRIYGEVSRAFITAITILVDEKGNRYPGYGRWPVDREPKGTDKGNSKANMAMIRSESQALEKMAPGQLPDDVGVVDTEFEELPTATKEITVDRETGEIIEAQTVVGPDLAQAEKDINELYETDLTQKPTKANSTPSEVKTGEVVPPPVKTTTIPTTKQALMTWVFSHKGLKANLAQVAGWITNPVSNQPYAKMEDVPDKSEDIQRAYGEIKNLQGWD
jgi:hypothetical protein